MLVADGATRYADYVVSATTMASSLLADATGYVTDGTHRLDFSNSVSVTTSQVSLDYSLVLNQPAVSAHLVATLAVGSTTSVLSATFSVARGSETVVLSGTLTATQTQSGFTASAQFVVTVNGGQFATITGVAQSGSTASFTYVGPGRALTQAERDAVDGCSRPRERSAPRWRACSRPSSTCWASPHRSRYRAEPGGRSKTFRATFP